MKHPSTPPLKLATTVAIVPNREASVHPAPDGQTELLRSWHAIWQRRLLVVGMAGLCVTAAAVYCFRTTPVYRAVATIEVAQQQKNIVRIEEVNKLALNQLDVLNTLVLKSSRATVLSRVVTVNNLVKHPGFRDGSEPPSESQVLAQVADCIKSQLRRNTRLIEVTADHPDPEVARMLANGVATQFIRQEVEDQTTATRFANVSLVEEADRLKGKLERSERLLQTYREQNKSVSLEDRQNIVNQKLHSLAQQLNDARSELTLILAQQEQARAATNSPGLLLALLAIKNDAVVAGLQTQLAQQETLVNLYATRYKEKYPKLIEARQRQVEMRHSLETAAIGALHTLDSVAEAARSKVQGLERASTEAEQQSLALSKLGIEYNILQRDMESDRNLYQSILQRLKETEVSKGIENTSLQVIEAAGLPVKPFKPNRPLLLCLGLLAGLVLGIGAALLLAQFDSSLKSVDETEERLGVPVVGALPMERQFEKGDLKLVMTSHPHSFLAEGFRSLRANIAMTGRLSARQTVLFTSAVMGEGKTMTACNYALALAQQGVKTLIVDLDMRRPQVGKMFSLAPELPGVSDYLLGRAKLENVAHPGGVANLDVVPAGGSIPNPSEQLAGPWLAQLLSEARSQYEVVVLDSCPVNPVSDTLGFLNLADLVLLVVCGRHTPVKAAQRAITMLQRSGMRPAGLILNRVSTRHGGYYYDYSYTSAKKAAA